jgi:hypothetical protein
MGRVLGQAARSLNHSESWLADQSTAKVGAKGEQRTGRILNALAAAQNGPTVLHDLRIPLPGVNANIDHIVVSGRRVTILDSKVWKPGFYWTLLGATRRGMERFAPADKQTMRMAREAVTAYLTKQGLRADVRTPLLGVPAFPRRRSRDRSCVRSRAHPLHRRQAGRRRHRLRTRAAPAPPLTSPRDPDPAPELQGTTSCPPPGKHSPRTVR